MPSDITHSKKKFNILTMNINHTFDLLGGNVKYPFGVGSQHFATVNVIGLKRLFTKSDTIVFSLSTTKITINYTSKEGR